jgi:membrane protein implicated in regulation of membrane protease activity
MIGERGIAMSGLQAGTAGMIRVHSELWSAVSPRDVAAGRSVRVLRVEGLKLHVEPVEDTVTVKT